MHTLSNEETSSSILRDNDNTRMIYSLQHLLENFGVSKTRLINDLFDPNILTYINIGRFDKQKGHDRLIRAFESYNEEFNNSRLLIVAPYGPIKKETIEQVKKSPVAENIYLLGRMNNPYPLLSFVDAFVLSSYYEGLGLVVYEALALDKQVITVNLDTTMKYLQNKEVISVDNSEGGILNGFLAFHNGYRTKNKFDFQQYKNNCINEFEALFNNK
ncbi:glycosyltransferase [Niallia sp. FSL W8-0635]|uniref:glycosyltransferase n=1 Tax=Niallia sp. FSL W8-0635 TaxID=2975337 RepID=UPI0030F841DC